MTSRIFALSLLLLTLIGCSESNPGIVLSIGAVHHAAADGFGDYPDIDPEEPRAFTSESGFDIVLTRGYVVLSGQRLHAHESAFRFVPRMLERVFGVASAYAHAAVSPTELATPYVIDVLGAERTLLSIGTMTPPPGLYEHLEVTLEAAEDHAHHLPEDVPGTMVGKTLYLEGTWKPAGMEVEPTAFSVTSAASIETELHLRDAGGDEAALPLPGGALRLVVGIGYESWFDSTDFDSMDSGEIAEAVMDEVEDSLTHFIDEVHLPDDHEHE